MFTRIFIFFLLGCCFSVRKTQDITPLLSKFKENLPSVNRGGFLSFIPFNPLDNSSSDQLGTFPFNLLDTPSINSTSRQIWINNLSDLTEETSKVRGISFAYKDIVHLDCVLTVNKSYLRSVSHLTYFKLIGNKFFIIGKSIQGTKKGEK